MNTSRAIKRTAKEYVASDGRSPFNEWLRGLRDVRAKAKVTKAITQMEVGNFGDHKVIKQGGGLYERRIHFGPGYRIYYVMEGDRLIVLFAGSDKASQNKVIALARQYLDDYKARQSEGI